MSADNAPPSPRQLGPFVCDAWTLQQSVIDNDASCAPPDSGNLYLLFEFWLLDNALEVDKRQLEDAYFLVARGVQPMVTYGSNVLTYSPPRMPYTQTGNNGTLVDDSADTYWRSYHRIVVPANANVSNNGSNDWFVTVANMDSYNGNSIQKYYIRVTCITEATAPCPRPLPRKGSCAGQGTCVAPPAIVERPALNRVCQCNPGWGEYGCQAPVPTLTNGATTSAVVDAGGWAFFQLRVPNPTSDSLLATVRAPSLLVELNRNTNGFGGDPLLVVMPKDADGSNRVPWFTDLSRYADLRSYFLQQNYHYLLLRDLRTNSTLPPLANSTNEDGSLPPPTSPTDTVYADFYVAVYNNDQRFTGKNALVFSRMNVTLRARWRTTTTAVALGPLCPGDCFGRGQCWDPWDLANTAALPPTILPPVASQPASSRPADFQCACRDGFGGTMCEAPLRNLTVGTNGDGMVGQLAQGQWQFFVLSFPRFDYRSNDVAIQWSIRDNPPTSDPPTAYVNSFLTIDEHAFPRNAQLDSDDPFRRGWQIFYNSLSLRSNPPQPLQMKGGDLKSGLNYVLGLYNSDYVRSQAYAFSVYVYVPTSPKTWLHPYMSVVLGVTASIILCLLLTLCRRIIQRYGWGLRGRNAAGEEEANGPGRVQVVHMASRNVGVPSHIVDAFPTYEYHATKAEKAQLAKSCRDHDAAMHQAAGGHTAIANAGEAGGGGGGGAVVMGQPSMRRSGTGAGADGGGGGAVVAAAAAAPTAAADPVVQHGNQLVAGGAGGGAAGGSSASSASAPAPVSAAVTAAVTPDDDDEPQCTVCLCEYEEGECITQLPCKHEFHCTCINKWLQTHSTCPICRISLLPDMPADGEEGSDPQQQQQAAVGVPVGGEPNGGGAAFVPVDGAPAGAGAGAAAAAAAAGQQGLFARVLGSMRRTAGGSNSTQVTVLGPESPAEPAAAAPPPPAAQQMVSMRRQRPASAASSGGGAAAAAPDPSPAALVSGGGGGSSSGGSVVVAAPSGAQLVARGPSATLEPPLGGGGGGSRSTGGTASAASSARGQRSPASPLSARLAAGRSGGSPPLTPVPLASPPPSGGGAQPPPSAAPPTTLAAAAPSGRPLRDGAALPSHLETEGLEEEDMDHETPQPPGVSSSSPRDAASASASPAGSRFGAGSARRG